MNKLKKKCWVSLVCDRENGLMVKSRASCPTLRSAPLNIVVSDWKLPPISKMKVSGLYFCAVCSRKTQGYDLALPVIPRIRVWATSRACRLGKEGVLLVGSTTAPYSGPGCLVVVSAV